VTISRGARLTHPLLLCYCASTPPASHMHHRDLLLKALKYTKPSKHLLEDNAEFATLVFWLENTKVQLPYPTKKPHVRSLMHAYYALRLTRFRRSVSTASKTARNCQTSISHLGTLVSRRSAIDKKQLLALITPVTSVHITAVYGRLAVPFGLPVWIKSCSPRLAAQLCHRSGVSRPG